MSNSICCKVKVAPAKFPRIFFFYKIKSKIKRFFLFTFYNAKIVHFTTNNHKRFTLHSTHCWAVPSSWSARFRLIESLRVVHHNSITERRTFQMLDIAPKAAANAVGAFCDSEHSQDLTFACHIAGEMRSYLVRRDTAIELLSSAIIILILWSFEEWNF